MEHLCLWQPEERLVAVGDALSDDVGWVDLALDGPHAAATAVASLQRLTDLVPHVILPALGPMPTDVGAALAEGAQPSAATRLDPDVAVWPADPPSRVAGRRHRP